MDSILRDSSGPNCPAQSVNPDISGIGVRLSFYLQYVLLVALVDRSWSDAPGALWTFISTSFGLTVAAIVQASAGQLSFFQALQVSNLVWMANFGSFLALASYSRLRDDHEKEQNGAGGKSDKAKPDDLVKFGVMFQIFFSMVLTFFIWTHPFAFDEDDCAQLVNYVIFFAATVPALGTGKILGLTFTSILTAGYLFLTLHELKSCCEARKHHKVVIHEDNSTTCDPPPSDIISPALLLYPPLSTLSPSTSSQGEKSDNRSLSLSGGSVRREKKKRHGKQHWSPKFDAMTLGHFAFLQPLVLVYFIISNELLLHRNKAVDSSDKVWGFGQVLALIVVVPSLVSVVRALHENGWRNLHHRKSKQSRSNGNVAPSSV